MFYEEIINNFSNFLRHSSYSNDLLYRAAKERNINVEELCRNLILLNNTEFYLLNYLFDFIKQEIYKKGYVEKIDFSRHIERTCSIFLNFSLSKSKVIFNLFEKYSKEILNYMIYHYVLKYSYTSDKAEEILNEVAKNLKNKNFPMGISLKIYILKNKFQDKNFQEICEKILKI